MQILSVKHLFVLALFISFLWPAAVPAQDQAPAEQGGETDYLEEYEYVGSDQTPAAQGEERKIYNDFEGQPTLLILPLRPQGIEPEIAENLTDLMALEVEKTGMFDVYSKKELQELLKLQEYKQLVGVEDDGELAKVGEKLGAKFLLHGNIGRVGGTYVLSLVLVDVKEVRAVRRVNQTLVGEPGGLIGSLRSAVLALSLEERGVAPDITGSLIDGLRIAEKPKTLFFHLRLGYEIPVGAVQDDSTRKFILPSLMVVNTEFAWQFHPYLQLVGSTGMALSLMNEFHNQNTQAFYRITEGDAEPSFLTNITTSRFDFQTYRIPIDIMINVRPPRGRLLPYFATGLGVSYQFYSFSDETIKRKLPEYPTPPCADPFSQEGDICIMQYDLPAADSKSYFNIDFPVAAGFDYLITDNIGISVEAKYLLTYALSGDFHADFVQDVPNEYTNEDGKAVAETTGDTVPLRRLHQGISLSFGVIAYY